jgi:hypothetical protein
MIEGYIGDGLFHCLFLIRGVFQQDPHSTQGPWQQPPKGSQDGITTETPAKTKTKMNISRKCPGCQAVLFYRNIEGWNRATLRKSLCKKCAGKVIPFRQENKAKQQPENQNPLAAFFNLIDAQMSASRQKT